MFHFPATSASEIAAGAAGVAAAAAADGRAAAAGEGEAAHQTLRVRGRGGGGPLPASGTNSRRAREDKKTKREPAERYPHSAGFAIRSTRRRGEPGRRAGLHSNSSRE